MQRKASGQGRDFFPSINDMQLPGEGPVVVREREPVMTLNGHAPATKAAAKDDTPNFELFTLIGPVRQVGPAMTLRADKRVSMNEAAYELLGRPLFVELLYDRQGATLGIRAATSTVAHAREVRSEKSSSARRYINIRALLAHYGIEGARTGRDAAKQYGDVLAVRLTLPEQAKGR